MSKKYNAIMLVVGLSLLVVTAQAEDPAAKQPAPAAPAATPSAPPSGIKESFDSLEQLTVEKGYKCLQADIALDLHDMHEGAGALKATWATAEDLYGEIKIVKHVPATDVTGATCVLWIKPLTDQGNGWGVQLWDADNKLVEEQRIWTLKKGEWYKMNFTVGTPMPKGLGTYYKAGDGDRTRVAKVVFRAVIKKAGEPQVALWDGFSVAK